MRLLAFSDLHLDFDAADRLVALSAPADLVIGAGDFADDRRGLQGIMDRLAPIAAKLLVVPGNNESIDELRGATNALVLHGNSTTRDGFVIAGIGGGVPPVPSSTGRSWDLGEAEAASLLDRIERADILVSHSPPFGLGDAHSQEGHVGSHAVKSALLRLSPSLCIFGHVHDCWGSHGRIGSTEWRNLGPDPVWFEL
ncbi:metallophosphoesterase [Palleronia sp. LCG004]|uniref:metallophosphoesterase family protein n=1 Tax=Palleronia sp. LCG004 TaxID=3079304 RepID=UPI002943CECF|nr:metallophosphoesterase [Palleronia sp. LCG004]WOI55478.1 metallophosphoesterase [Palleronia sp. LCG004]